MAAHDLLAVDAAQQGGSKSRKGEHWTAEEHCNFLLGLQELGRGSWRAISDKYIPTRTPAQVASHSQKYFLKLEGGNRKRKAPMSSPLAKVQLAQVPSVMHVEKQQALPLVVLPSESTSVCASGKSVTTHQYCRVGITSETAVTHGEHWTDDEHAAFLQGLAELGRGAWRAISERFVPSRSPTQVASHSQKYFLKLEGGNKKRRGSSAHSNATPQFIRKPFRDAAVAEFPSSADLAQWTVPASAPGISASLLELPSVLPGSMQPLNPAPAPVDLPAGCVQGVQLPMSFLPLLQHLSLVGVPQLCAPMYPSATLLPSALTVFPCAVPTMGDLHQLPSDTTVPALFKEGAASSARVNSSTDSATTSATTSNSGGVARPRAERASDDFINRLWGIDPDAAAAMVLGALKETGGVNATQCVPFRTSAQSSAFRSPAVMGL